MIYILVTLHKSNCWLHFIGSYKVVLNDSKCYTTELFDKQHNVGWLFGDNSLTYRNIPQGIQWTAIVTNQSKHFHVYFYSNLSIT